MIQVNKTRKDENIKSEIDSMKNIKCRTIKKLKYFKKIIGEFFF